MKYQKSKIKRDNKKQEIVKRLKKNPVVQVACQNAGSSRSSYYRWRKQDKQFAKDCDKALAEGRELISDMAESQLISAIKDKNLTAIIYWLKSNSKRYATKVELDARHRIEEFKLNKKQEKLIEEAIKKMDLNNE